MNFNHQEPNKTNSSNNNQEVIDLSILEGVNGPSTLSLQSFNGRYETKIEEPKIINKEEYNTSQETYLSYETMKKSKEIENSSYQESESLNNYNYVNEFESKNDYINNYNSDIKIETVPQSENNNQTTTSTLKTDYNSREKDKSFNITTIFAGILAFIIFSTLFYIIYKMIKYHFTKDTPRYVIIFISIIIIGLLMLFASIINIPDTDPYQYQRMSRK